MKRTTIAPFLDREGRIAELPAREKRRLAVLRYLAQKFEPGRVYGEKEVNAICESWHTFGDFHLMRRLLVDAGLMGRERDGSRYWRIETEETPID